MKQYWLDAMVYLVRGKGQELPFAVVAARDRQALFNLVDEDTDPHQCEVAPLHENEGFFWDEAQPSITEGLQDRFETAGWEPLVNDELERIFRRQKLTRTEKEVADLGRIFKDLKRKSHDRFNRHR